MEKAQLISKSLLALAFAMLMTVSLTGCSDALTGPDTYVETTGTGSGDGGSTANPGGEHNENGGSKAGSGGSTANPGGEHNENGG